MWWACPTVVIEEEVGELRREVVEGRSGSVGGSWDWLFVVVVGGSVTVGMGEEMETAGVFGDDMVVWSGSIEGEAAGEMVVMWDVYGGVMDVVVTA
ncbi:hypothetical protein Tco_1103839 [Tanacetum coccineum]